ncbi:MAG: hypothetical protein J2P19_01835 [Pseudonocardia sp.]|nr:hypothetical protein [Pseudonocardia sp.]
MTVTTTPTPTAARYDALDRAGDRCECRHGECGAAHTDTGGGRCPTVSHWPDVVDLVVTPTDPELSLDDVDGLPAEALTVRCWDCWRGAHQAARGRGEIVQSTGSRSVLSPWMTAMLRKARKPGVFLFPEPWDIRISRLDEFGRDEYPELATASPARVSTEPPTAATPEV